MGGIFGDDAASWVYRLWIAAGTEITLSPATYNLPG